MATVNNGLSVRIDKTRSTLASTDAQLLALKSQRAAEQQEWETLQSMMTARLANKDELIASLQRQIAQPPSEPAAPVENDTGGV